MTGHVSLDQFHLDGYGVYQALPGLLTASVTVLTAMSDICHCIWRKRHVAFSSGQRYVVRAGGSL